MQTHAKNPTLEVARVLHGMRQIREAAQAVSGHNVLNIPRDELLAGYWFLLQATLSIEHWPLHLQEGFHEIRERFFADGLPPTTVSRMSEHEAQAVVSLIQAFHRRAEETLDDAPQADASQAVVNRQPAVVAGGKLDRARTPAPQWVPAFSTSWSLEKTEACRA